MNKDLNGFRVLFVYPSQKTKPRIPLAASILIAVLKQHNATVRLFDTTYMQGDPNFSDKTRGRTGYVKESNIEEYYGHIEEMDANEELCRELREYQPHLVAFTVLEHNYSLSIRLAETAKREGKYPTLFGGIMPTVAPEMFLRNSSVDMVCVGEGEGAIIDVCKSIRDNNKRNDISNIWYRNNGGKIIQNELRQFVDLDMVPHQDWTLFDKRSLYKSYCGKAYKCGSFEMTRGCMKSCSFCVAPAIRKMQSCVDGRYRRRKSPEKLISEIASKKREYGLEMVHFCDTEFLLGVPGDYLTQFADLYQKEIGLPFIMQTGVETINEEKLDIIRRAGCVSISIGVESGVEDFRKKVLNKKITDQMIMNAFEVAKRYGIRTTANYMIGLPYETEEDILRTIEFNNKLKPPSISVCYFVPFLGTELYDICVKEGFYPRFNPDADIFTESCLRQPHLSKERISELMDLFVSEQHKNENNS